MFMSRVEMQLTYRCNLKCRMCNRLCDKFPLDDDMTVGQVETFVRKLEEERRTIVRIKLVGGEPTLHPDFLTICELLSAAVQKGLVGKVAVNSNGLTQSQFTKPLPPGVNWKLSPAKNKRHRPYLWSPKDLGLVGRGPCKMPRICGFSLDVKGWLPCSGGVAIARLFGHEHLYRPLDGPLPTKEWGMAELCQDCIHGIDDFFATDFKSMPVEWDKPSPRWAEAMEKYERERSVSNDTV